ncbi:hypothetical protein LH51_15490 [Nitrincola sp. A-D6]|nr:hypothetical protein LH51_15490 [Nitrincola sp. A-D6]
MIQIAAKLIAAGDSKVIDPATYKLTCLKKLVMHADTPVAIGELPYPLLEFMLRLLMPFDQAIYGGRQITWLRCLGPKAFNATGSANSPPAYVLYDVLAGHAVFFSSQFC